jgi:hypothetical protein
MLIDATQYAAIESPGLLLTLDSMSAFCGPLNASRAIFARIGRGDYSVQSDYFVCCGSVRRIWIIHTIDT